jgi:hypothetical protein
MKSSQVISHIKQERTIKSNERTDKWQAITLLPPTVPPLVMMGLTI